MNGPQYVKTGKNDDFTYPKEPPESCCPLMLTPSMKVNQLSLETTGNLGVEVIWEKYSSLMILDCVNLRNRENVWSLMFPIHGEMTSGDNIPFKVKLSYVQTIRGHLYVFKSGHSGTYHHQKYFSTRRRRECQSNENKMKWLSSFLKLTSQQSEIQLEIVWGTQCSRI